MPLSIDLPRGGISGTVCAAAWTSRSWPSSVLLAPLRTGQSCGKRWSSRSMSRSSSSGSCRLCLRFGNPGPALPLTGSPGVLLFHTHGWLFRSVRRPSPHPRAPRLDRRSQPAPRCLDASAMRRAGRKCNDVAPVGRKRLPDRQTHARYLDRWNPSSGDVGRADTGRRPAVVRVPGMRSTLPARVLTGDDRLQAMSPS